jgi:hypothetical protein
MRSQDLYDDEDWNKLEQLPNPVTSTTTYCLINGEKKEYRDYAYDCCGGKQDAKVKCWKDRQVVVDLGRLVSDDEFEADGSRKVKR